MDTLRSKIKRDTDMAKHGSEGPIPLEVRVGVTTRILVGAHPLDLIELFHVPSFTERDKFHETIMVVNNEFRMPGWPRTEKEPYKARVILNTIESCRAPFIVVSAR